MLDQESEDTRVAHDAATLLTVEGVESGYGDLQVLSDIHLEVAAGERIVMLGPNGAGKTTLLKTIVGLLPCWRGEIRWEGQRIDHRAVEARIQHGLAFVSEGGVIPDLSVEENLRIGAYFLPRARMAGHMATVYEKFPVLKEKRRQLGRSLSGGQRKLLAVAKALMSQPKLIVMDEPSAGLSPLFVSEVIAMLQRFHEEEHLGLLIAEQNVKFLDLADRVHVLDGGRLQPSRTVEELHADDAIRHAYFGLQI